MAVKRYKYSFANKNHALAALGISIYGFIMGLRSFSEKHKNQRFCKIGAMANGVIMVIWLALFLVGLS